jgi:hypothetical protein
MRRRNEEVKVKPKVDVTDIVREMNRTFWEDPLTGDAAVAKWNEYIEANPNMPDWQRQELEGGSKTYWRVLREPRRHTKETMQKMVNKMREQINQVVDSYQKSGLSGATLLEIGGKDQFESEINNIKARIDHYQNALDSITTSGQESAKDAFAPVFLPLVMGIYTYYRDVPKIRMPGIGSMDEQGPPDFIAPWSLTNQLQEIVDVNEGLWSKFWQDIWANIMYVPTKVAEVVGNVIESVKPAIPWVALAVGGVILIGGGLFIASRVRRVTRVDNGRAAYARHQETMAALRRRLLEP